MQKKMDASEERAWEIYCHETAGDMDVKDNWFQLSDKVRLKYLDKAQKQKKVDETTEDKITQEDLKEWFGEAMPMSVFKFIFNEAPPEMTTAELKAKVREMGVEYRSPESLSVQSYVILCEAKRHGNLAPKLVKEIDAWESRFLIHRREVDQQ